MLDACRSASHDGARKRKGTGLYGSHHDTIRRLRWVAPLAILTATVSHAQQDQHDPDAFVLRQRAVEERLRKQFDAELAFAQKSLFDWGGWYSTHIFLFDDGVESSRTLRRSDLRLWGRLSIDGGAHELYARGRLSLLDFNSGDSFDGDDDDVEGPNLERGFYRFDLARAMRAYGDRDIDYNVQLQIGRDLVQFGTGLTLAAPLDHVKLVATLRDVELTGFIGRTVGSTEDFDRSRTATRTRRAFFGAQLRHRGFERHEPFVYGLWQRDHNAERRAHLFQKFTYDSFYFGMGSTGELRNNLRYLIEGVYESGSSYGTGRYFGSDEINAWAFDAELEYLYPGPRRARASIEYLFASGDSNRKQSPTNSIGGNRFDRSDTSFIGFGYRDTGLALAPRYSNLHMWRAGGSLYPWPDRSRLERLQLGADVYLFHKHRRGGAISDVTADRASGYLGWEMDYYVNWEATVDLTWTARFGAFFPGRAFSDRTTRTFLLLGMTWSF